LVAAGAGEARPRFRYDCSLARHRRATTPRACRHLRSPPGAWESTPPEPQEGDENIMAPVVTMRQLLEAGVHFGHQTRRWNPKMKRFIFGERSGIYIIDLEKTLDALNETYEFLMEVGRRGGSVLFVGTKKQAQEIVQEQAGRVGMPFVNTR